MLSSRLGQMQAQRWALNATLKASQRKPMLLASSTAVQTVNQTNISTTAVQRSGDHVKLWTAERVVSAAMIPGFVGPFLFTTPATDALLCTLSVLHSHWGKFYTQMI